MTFPLETAAHPETLRRVAIDPVSRVEGHGKVTLLLDANNHIEQVRLHIVEFRGFEKFIEGRPYWEVPVMVQRLCGICPVSHHLAAAKAFDRVIGAAPVSASANAVPPVFGICTKMKRRPRDRIIRCPRRRGRPWGHRAPACGLGALSCRYLRL